jgi:hypothetical protein
MLLYVRRVDEVELLNQKADDDLGDSNWLTIAASRAVPCAD